MNGKNQRISHTKVEIVNALFNLGPIFSTLREKNIWIFSKMYSSSVIKCGGRRENSSFITGNPHINQPRPTTAANKAPLMLSLIMPINIQPLFSNKLYLFFVPTCKSFVGIH